MYKIGKKPKSKNKSQEKNKEPIKKIMGMFLKEIKKKKTKNQIQ